MRVAVLLIVALLLALRGAQAEPSSLTVPIIKLEYPGNPPGIHTVYVRVLSLGGRKVNFPILLDTGSAGVTIECTIVLPLELCGSDGIRIEEDRALPGLTVTTRRIVSRYGTYDEYGNLAYARMTFGDAKRPVTTTEMPVLIRYKQVRRATGEVVGGPLWPKGIFGIAPVAGQVEGLLASPMDHVEMPAGLRRGFYLTPLGEQWSICTNERGDCPAVDALQIGLNESSHVGFTMMPLGASASEHYQPFVDTCLTWSESQSCAPALYDTGNATVAIAGPPPEGGAMTLAPGTEITHVGAKDVFWRFTVRDPIEVEFAPHSDINLIGIRYFETNSLLFDLDAGEIGFRIGR